MSKKRTLIYSWVGHNNLGDELFKPAFAKLLPNHELTFVDTIPTSNNRYDLLILGGGSFLDQSVACDHYPDGARAPTFKEPIFGGGLGTPNCIPICYIGVGCGEQPNSIHLDHEILLRHSKFAALRSNAGLDAVSKLTKAFVIPDLVYSLHQPTKITKTPAQDKSVLVIPNISCVPKYSDASWMHNAWSHFKFEFAQLLDQLITDGYLVSYLPMCDNPKQLDARAMVEILNLMHKAHLVDAVHLPNSTPDIKQLVEVFARFGTVITQRYHGMVLAELSHTCYLSIAHHDKLNASFFGESRGVFASYYACNKSSLLKSFDAARALSPPISLFISPHLFDPLQTEVLKLLE